MHLDILYTVFVMTPPMNTPVREGETIGGVPYHAESALSSAQVLKLAKHLLGMAGQLARTTRAEGRVGKIL